MTQYGLLSTGFLPEPLTALRADIEASLRSAFGASLALGDRSILGQIVGILAERLALLWELLEAVNSSQDPDKASGAALEALCILTGTTRPAAAASTVALILTGTNATSIPASSTVSTTTSGKNFATTSTVVLATVSAWAALTAYAVGDRVTQVSNVYQCITAGTSAASFVPSPATGSALTDGTVVWTYIGAGTAAADATANATVTGATVADARDLTVIVNALSGWSSSMNLLAASPGRDIATDTELRSLRVAELAGDGKSTGGAIRAALLKVTGVTAATVFQNNTDTVNSDSMPPHSVEALVRIPAGVPNDQLVWDALLANVAAGILTTGNTPGSSTDSEGTVHTVSYSRPTEIPIYVVINVTKDPALYPSDGDTQIKQAIDDWGSAQATGKNAVASAISSKAFLVAGVLDVTSCYIGLFSSPAPSTSVTIAISLRQLATYSVAHITVNSIDGIP